MVNLYNEYLVCLSITVLCEFEEDNETSFNAFFLIWGDNSPLRWYELSLFCNTNWSNIGLDTFSVRYLRFDNKNLSSLRAISITEDISISIAIKFSSFEGDNRPLAKQSIQILFHLFSFTDCQFSPTFVQNIVYACNANSPEFCVGALIIFYFSLNNNKYFSGFRTIDITKYITITITIKFARFKCNNRPLSEKRVQLIFYRFAFCQC